MSLSTIRRRLRERYLQVRKVPNADNLYRLYNFNFALYVGGYDCYYTFDDLVEIATATDDDSDE